MLSLCCCLTSLQNVSFPTWLKRLCNPSWSSNKKVVFSYDTGTNRHTKLLHSLITGFLQIFGSKMQDLFPDFFQNNNFFFHTHNYQMGDQQRPLKNEGKKHFPRYHKNEDEEDLASTKKIALATFETTSQDFSNIFSRSGKWLGKFQDSVWTLWLHYV